MMSQSSVFAPDLSFIIFQSIPQQPAKCIDKRKTVQKKKGGGGLRCSSVWCVSVILAKNKDHLYEKHWLPKHLVFYTDLLCSIIKPQKIA